jgi:hypothetical protein
MFWLPLINLLNNSINKKLTSHQTDMICTHNKKEGLSGTNLFFGPTVVFSTHCRITYSIGISFLSGSALYFTNTSVKLLCI